MRQFTFTIDLTDGQEEVLKTMTAKGGYDSSTYLKRCIIGQLFEDIWNSSRDNDQQRSELVAKLKQE